MNFKKLSVLLIMPLLLTACFWQVKTLPEEPIGDNQNSAEIPVVPPPPQDFITLTDVSGGQGYGDGYRTQEATLFIYKAAVTLAEPTGGNFYEAWLFNPTLGNFISLGKMSKMLDRWIISYESETDYSDFTKMVITSEPNDNDPAPAKHILEGNFVN